MKVTCVWEERMRFQGKTAKHEIAMDAKSPIGSDSAPTPKELLLAGVCGCSAMDVVALMKKYRQPLEKFEVESETETTDSHPSVFKEVLLKFKLSGAIEPEKAKEAVQLSMTRYCGVSAMISKVVPMRYQVEVNGAVVGEGVAQFDI